MWETDPDNPNNNQSVYWSSTVRPEPHKYASTMAGPSNQEQPSQTQYGSVFGGPQPTQGQPPPQVQCGGSQPAQYGGPLGAPPQPPTLFPKPPGQPPPPDYGTAIQSSTDPSHPPGQINHATVVVAQPVLGFKRTGIVVLNTQPQPGEEPILLEKEPTRIKCPHCRVVCTTVTEKKIGKPALICMGRLILIGIFFPPMLLLCICLAPLCTMKDVHHSCPNCGKEIGVWMVNTHGGDEHVGY